jgi:hypothetical protein
MAEKGHPAAGEDFKTDLCDKQPDTTSTGYFAP